MTDNEIIKALECCIHDDYDYCKECPYLKNKPCHEGLIQDAFDLINRQKAEIERLERHTEMYHEVRAEAVKEFAELLKEHIRDYHPYYYVIDEEVVDNLVEEMVGENNVPCN